PLTLSIQKCLLCEIFNGIYAFPIDLISEIVEVNPKDFYEIQKENVIKVREKVIHVRKLNELFPSTIFNSDDLNPTSQNVLVILNYKSHYVAVPVNQLIGEEDIVVKSLNRNFKNIDGISGATIMGDGKVALIVDVVYVLENLVQNA
ncbi:hypothetical protein BVY03_00220, partial [bacterium K02(2017)]